MLVRATHVPFINSVGKRHAAACGGRLVCAENLPADQVRGMTAGVSTLTRLGPDWHPLLRYAETQLSLGTSAVIDCPFAREALFRRAQAIAEQVGWPSPRAAGSGGDHGSDVAVSLMCCSSRQCLRIAWSCGGHKCWKLSSHIAGTSTRLAAMRDLRRCMHGAARRTRSTCGLPAVGRGGLAGAPGGACGGGRRHGPLPQASELGRPAEAARVLASVGLA